MVNKKRLGRTWRYINEALNRLEVLKPVEVFPEL